MLKTFINFLVLVSFSMSTLPALAEGQIPKSLRGDQSAVYAAEKAARLAQVNDVVNTFSSYIENGTGSADSVVSNILIKNFAVYQESLFAIKQELKNHPATTAEQVVRIYMVKSAFEKQVNVMDHATSTRHILTDLTFAVAGLVFGGVVGWRRGVGAQTGAPLASVVLSARESAVIGAFASIGLSIPSNIIYDKVSGEEDIDLTKIDSLNAPQQ